MRSNVAEHFLQTLQKYNIQTNNVKAIDVGGNREVYLLSDSLEPVSWRRKTKNLILTLLREPLPEPKQKAIVTSNPLLKELPGLRFFDFGYTASYTGTDLDINGNLLNEADVAPHENQFDIVICLDTLEHVSNPFKFCDNLVRLAKPGGHIYLNTVFSWEYHPSPQDYFRFSPTGLIECFAHSKATILECSWHVKEVGVYAFLRKPLIEPDLR